VNLAKKKGSVVSNTRWTTAEGVPIVVLMRDPTEFKLSTKCFRGRECHCAGNFSQWESAQEMFRDEGLLELLIHDALRSLTSSVSRRRVSLDLGRNIGWSGTDAVSNYNSEDLEVYRPNWKCTALRVRFGAIHLKAPLTSLVTVIYQIKYEEDRGQFAVVIHSTYPGMDIGEMSGNVTEDRGIVFFGLKHPGE